MIVRKAYAICSIFLVLSVADPSARGAEPVQSAAASVLQEGTPIRIRINRNLSSADAKVGESVDFEILDELNVADVVVAPKGGLALATVTEAASKKSMGRGGKLNVNIDHLRLVDGEKVPLRAVKENQGGGHVGAMTGAMIATSIVFFPAAPLFLFMKGKDITIPKGTEITAYINGDFPIELAKFRPTPPTPATSPATPSQTATSEFATVAISSIPEGADISVDGKFLGNTPATVRLASGDHLINVEKAGFKIWQRSVSTTAGSTLTIAPSLEPNPQ